MIGIIFLTFVFIAGLIAWRMVQIERDRIQRAQDWIDAYRRVEFEELCRQGDAEHYEDEIEQARRLVR